MGVLADIVVVLHLAFVAFVLLGGFLVTRWPRLFWVHLPAALWGAWIEFAGWVCPLTPVETWLRRRAGQTGYSGGFVEHYLLPLLYPEDAGPPPWLLGTVVLVINAVAYGWVVTRRMRVESRRAALRS